MRRIDALAAPLSPGRALDVGCGEGADSLWLAQQGWRVTGVDIAQSALSKTRAHAAVAPGGTLLIVGHDASDVGHASAHKNHLAKLMFNSDDVLAAIVSEDLVVDYAGSRKREAPPAEGSEFMHDVVVMATRAK